MINIEECEKYINKLNLNNTEIEELRNSVYLIVDSMLENYLAEKYETKSKN